MVINIPDLLYYLLLLGNKIATNLQLNYTHYYFHNIKQALMRSSFILRRLQCFGQAAFLSWENQLQAQ